MKTPQTHRQSLRLLLPGLLALTLPSLAIAEPAAPAPSPAPAAQAGTAQTYTYTGEAKGVTCGSCARIVTAGLKKMPGVTSVKVILTKQPGQATLQIQSTSPVLNKQAADKALGTNAETFPVQFLKLEPKP